MLLFKWCNDDLVLNISFKHCIFKPINLGWNNTDLFFVYKAQVYSQHQNI